MELIDFWVLANGFQFTLQESNLMGWAWENHQTKQEYLPDVNMWEYEVI